MNDKEDVLRKVQSILRLAANPGATEHERTAARKRAITLRLKYGISDADIEAIEARDEHADTEFMGHKWFYYNDHIQPHVQKIKDEIDKAAAKAETLDPLNRADIYSKLFKAVRQLVDGPYWKGQLKDLRDKAVKAYYTEVADEYKTTHGDVVSETMAHEWARDRVASTCDIRKDTVERIVGVSSDGLWKKELRTHICQVCGLDGNEKREMCDLYEVDGQRVWRHPACHQEANNA